MFSSIGKNKWLIGALFLVWLILSAWRLMMRNRGLDTRGATTWIEITCVIHRHRFNSKLVE